MSDDLPDTIRPAAVPAVTHALDPACESPGILPHRAITALLWAEFVLAASLAQGRLPTQVDRTKMLEGVPPLFISDRNK